MLAVYGDRPAALANDLTKLYEVVQRGTISSIQGWAKAQDKLRGEFVVVIGGAGELGEEELEDGMGEAENE
jgi:16S rRNA (cytidine1402-2'-O)-methyltransferase